LGRYTGPVDSELNLGLGRTRLGAVAVAPALVLVPFLPAGTDLRKTDNIVEQSSPPSRWGHEPPPPSSVHFFPGQGLLTLSPPQSQKKLAA